ncbi:MAG: ROK family protein [Armatimonadota bacterium]|nr:ROK family protein [Armatimonadota bacterium]
MTLFLGIDIGGTKIASGLVTDAGVVVRREDVPTPAREGGPRVLEAAIALARSLGEMAGETVQGVGIGTGGQVDADRGMIVSATELLPGWAGIGVQAAFENALRLPSFVDNDVNALAMGEARFGAAQNARSVVFLALGTGVGGALLLEGRLHRGVHWSGGEFGHILLTMDENARRDAGGHRGTLEAYAAGPGLVQTWRELTGDTRSPMTGQTIAAEAARAPDGPAAQAVTRTGEYLGFGLVSLANALDPELIVIGGGLAALGDALLDPARHILQTHALHGPANCPVVPASLGPDASLIGAASLIMPEHPHHA